MSIYDKKYQIFVSSTYTDLIQARDEVIKVVLGLYQIPIGMEMFSADNEEQWSIIKSTIDNSDYYLLIIGHRYGSLTKEKISFTEKEFDYAKEQQIPIIAFVKNRNTPTKPEERDSDHVKAEMLNAFVDKVLNNSMCDFWETENELGQKVAIALTKIFFKTPRTGWVRSDKTNMVETTEQLTALIQENRELRNELEQIKSQNSKEKPRIEISLNGKKELSLNHEKPETKIKTSLIDIEDLSSDEIHEISKKEINAYNTQIELKKVEIEKYVESFNEYESKNKFNTPIQIQVSNFGTVKANDVYIDLIFPKEIKVFEKVDLDDLERPKQPEMPENPVERFRKKKAKKIGVTSGNNMNHYKCLVPDQILITPRTARVRSKALALQDEDLHQMY